MDPTPAPGRPLEGSGEEGRGRALTRTRPPHSRGLGLGGRRSPTGRGFRRVTPRPLGHQPPLPRARALRQVSRGPAPASGSGLDTAPVKVGPPLRPLRSDGDPWQQGPRTAGRPLLEGSPRPGHLGGLLPLSPVSFSLPNKDGRRTPLCEAAGVSQDARAPSRVPPTPNAERQGEAAQAAGRAGGRCRVPRPEAREGWGPP